MGFSSDWVSIMKGIVPEAFTPMPDAPNTKGVFIDGQIQLMKPQFITTMDLFYKVQFSNLINRYIYPLNGQFVFGPEHEYNHHRLASVHLVQLFPGKDDHVGP